MRKILCLAVCLLLLSGCAVATQPQPSPSAGVDSKGFIIVSMPIGKNAGIEIEKDTFLPGAAFSAYVYTTGMDFSGEDADVWISLISSSAPHGGAEKDFSAALEYHYIAEYNGGRDIPFVAPEEEGAYQLRLYTSFTGAEIGYLPFTVSGAADAG
ncbi:MAG: hypothetical protein ACOX17_09615 [Christensenellales bacterium]|jgi:hypothetical protein